MYQVKQYANGNSGMTILVFLVATEQEAKDRVEGLKLGGREAWYVKE